MSSFQPPLCLIRNWRKDRRCNWRNGVPPPKNAALLVRHFVTGRKDKIARVSLGLRLQQGESSASDKLMITGVRRPPAASRALGAYFRAHDVQCNIRFGHEGTRISCPKSAKTDIPNQRGAKALP